MQQTELEVSEYVCVTKVSCGSARESGGFAFAAAVNEAAAKGAALRGAWIKIMLPDSTFKSRMNGMRKFMKKLSEEAGIGTAEIEAGFNPALKCPMTIVTVYGQGNATPRRQTASWEKANRKGGEIVQAGWLGLAGTLYILEEKEEELSARFTRTFLGQIRSYRSQIFADKKIEAAIGGGAGLIRQADEGGILAALHYLAQDAGKGLSVDMKKMFVKQETIEVCEHFRLNPYQLMSAGCFLAVADDGEALAARFRQEGMEAAVIGRLTDNHDKIITNGEEFRYVDRPAPDEWMKIWI